MRLDSTNFFKYMLQPVWNDLDVDDKVKNFILSLTLFIITFSVAHICCYFFAELITEKDPKQEKTERVFANTIAQMNQNCDNLHNSFTEMSKDIQVVGKSVDEVKEVMCTLKKLDKELTAKLDELEKDFDELEKKINPKSAFPND